ncbi:MAG: methanogenesis marker 3 protein [Methanomicrobiales archaeon]|nr:methanogenesis marker 3 protein [Methanomicrobiales archaeon]
MPTIHIDGKIITTPDGSTVDDVLPDRNPDLSIGIIRPVTVSRSETREFLLKTSAGEIVVETVPDTKANEILSGLSGIKSGWIDVQAASFGPFSSSFAPSRRSSRYDRGDVALGCGGYDPDRSFLVLCRKTHVADHGGPKEGGVIARIISGMGVMDRLSENDHIISVEPVISFAESSDVQTTTDGSLLLEEGMHLVTYVHILAEGVMVEKYDPHTAESVDLMLLALQNSVYTVDKRLSNHIRCDVLAGTDVPNELCDARKEGTVLMRTSGKKRGSIYIYIQDLPRSLGHTVVGNVVSGIELCRIAREGDRLLTKIEPARFDLVGLSLADARRQAEGAKITLIPDVDEQNRIVIAQKPVHTLEVLANGSVNVCTIPDNQVIAITLDDEKAPSTCRIFREVTGLKYHAIGKIPMLFSFDEVTLFKTNIPKTVNVMPENIPVLGVDGAVLAMTNDSCKGVGIVGVRSVASSEFGPTSEPFSGTNMIGTVLEMDKIAGLEEGEMVYFKEVRQ